MDTDVAGSAPAGGRVLSGRARGRRGLGPRLLVPAVVVSLASLVTASAWEALRPAAPVRVAPVVFAGGAQDASPVASPGAPQPAMGASAGAEGRAAQAAGWLEPDPYTVACTALADGVVAEVLALEGERVERGQVIARLVDEDARLALRRGEAELSLASADADRAAAALAAAQEVWDNPVERDRRVAVAQAQLRETEAELAQLPSLVEAERAGLERLREELARLRDASASGAASSIELMTASRRVEAGEAAVRGLEARGPILEAKRDRLGAEVLAAVRDAELRTADRESLDAARAGAERARAAVARAQAARDEAALRLARMTIRAPITGLVQRRLKGPGDKVMLGMDDPHSAHLLHLYDPERMQVRVDVPLADAAGVVVGQRCEVVVEVLPDRVFEGEVTRVTHEADLQKNTLEVKVRVESPAPVLKPEMLARVRFLAGAGSGGGAGGAGQGPAGRPAADSRVRVPAGAVRTDGSGASVWVVHNRRRDRGEVSRVAVELGGLAGGWYSASGDLHPGDLLVLGDRPLAPGQRVRVTAIEGGAD